MSLFRGARQRGAQPRRQRETSVLQAPGAPPLPPRVRSEQTRPPWETARDGPTAPQPVRPVWTPPLPTVEELAARLTQETPVITRRAPRAEAGPHYPDFHLSRFPAAAAIAALPKVTYPRPTSPLSDYNEAMQVVSVLTGTETPPVWHRPAVETAATSDEEITAWGRHLHADLLRRLAAAQRAIARSS